MKKNFLFFLFILTSFMLRAQQLDKGTALQLVARNSKDIGLSADDLNNLKVSDAYIDKQAGNVTMLYLLQTYKGLPVHNQLQVLAFKNGQLISKAGGRIPMESLAKNASIVPVIAAQAAVYSALASKKIVATKPASIVNTTDNGRSVEFNNLGISSKNITSQLMWSVPSIGKGVRLSWEVHVIPVGTSDDWLIRVDANTGIVIGVDNLTVYCNWDDPNHATASGHQHNDVISKEMLNSLPFNAGNNVSQPANSPSIINGASYRVVPFPAESPIHPGGTPVLVTDPWTIAPGNATSLKWNSDGTTDFNTTRGNNVRAYEDRSNTASGGGGNPGTGLPATSTTADPLTFDFVPDFTVTPTQTSPVQNQQFNITNLFYWNNIIHDLTYQYGFDEVSGNFQANNQSRGGNGNDAVLAEAQDGGGTNNANFNTPVDGISGRMQMYLWSGNPQKDGDVDNGIIVHEYGHGISNRLTGGPSNSSCLQNAEQMGEGWSDYYGLMYTQNWATSTLTTGFDSPRGIGTYALGQPITGLGIRSQRYTTNFAINNKVYGATIPSTPHDRGEIWCATLWDMTWNIINQVGTINPNLFNAAGAGGNAIALRLVTQGMKLQPCSPGFISGRDAILAADQLLYGGTYACAIKEAFRRRGMGDGASQGSSASVTDQIPSFVGGLTLKLSENIVTVAEGQNIVYTNTVTTCSPVSNYLLTDTLPTNVTYVSGGTYNAATRVVSFPVTLGQGGSQNYVFTVNVNAGSYFPPINLLDEQVTGTTIPASWTATAATGPSNWVVSSALSHTAPNSFFGIDNANAITDFSLATTNPIVLDATPPTFSFWHNYNTESTWDGGVVEISTNGGTTWSDLGNNMLQNGYNNTFSAGTILAGRRAFSGTSNGFIQTKVSLDNYAGQSVKLRFRALSDDNTAATGWYVDDILLRKIAEVKMRSSIFNASGVRVNVSDTIAEITPPVGCTSAAISTQPVNASACSGSNTTFTVVATGTSPTYQWQVSTNSGTSWTDITGATTATLTLTTVTSTMTNNQYRVVVSNSCPSSVTSAAATLTVSDAASINTQPASTSACTGANASFTIVATGTALTYQWQVSTNGGTSWTDITGQTASTLSLTAVTAAQNNNQYRVIIFSCSPTGTTSNPAILTVNTPAAITAQPASIAVCENATATFTAAASGTTPAYQWQVSTNGGTSWTNITGATAATYSLTGVTASLSGNQYRSVVTNACTPAGINSNAATLTVNSLVAISAQPTATAVCAGLNASFSVTAAGTGLTYQWQVSTNGGSTWTNITGATSATLSLTSVTVAMNTNQYRAVLNGTCTTNLNSSAVVLTVNTPVTIVSQPVSTSTCTGSNASFGVSALGTTVTYQWQVSINGGAYVNIANGSQYAGVTTNQLTVLNASSNINGFTYRVVVSGVPCGGTASSGATLTVNTLPVVVATLASFNRITPYVQTQLSTTISPAGTYSYQWYKNGVAASNLTSAIVPLNVDAFGEYKVLVTDSKGCSSFSNNVTLSDSASTLLFIYPNPNKGHFQVRYYNAGGGSIGRTINIYDAKGTIVYTKPYSVSNPYGKMDVDFKASAGVYFVDLKDASGKTLATGRVVISQ